MFLAEVHPLKIMKITGHRTEKAFLRYIRISQEDNAKGLAEHPYFKENSNLDIVKDKGMKRYSLLRLAKWG